MEVIESKPFNELAAPGQTKLSMMCMKTQVVRRYSSGASENGTN
jgi:hypothetical protein